MNESARQWFARRTSTWRDWPVDMVAAAKNSTVSVVLPALDEEDTVGAIVHALTSLQRRTGLIDEIVVIDSGSVDQTATVAAGAGAVVYHGREILAAQGHRPGKGEVLWKALAVTRGEILVYIDADLLDFREHYVVGLLGPLFADPAITMVKAFYDRPLLDVAAAGGGRVTELLARPLISAFFPALAGMVQPLAGEYAARRSLLASLPFAAGYGVEIGLLIDTYQSHGLAAIAQVDLGHRTHGHQDTAALGRMAATILDTVMRRLDIKHPDPGTVLTQFVRTPHGTIEPVEVQVLTGNRPAFDSLSQVNPIGGRPVVPITSRGRSTPPRSCDDGHDHAHGRRPS